MVAVRTSTLVYRNSPAQWTKTSAVIIFLIVFGWILSLISFSVGQQSGRKAHKALSKSDNDRPHVYARPITLSLLHVEQNEWIEQEFQAADPSLQEWCQDVLLKGEGGTSQYGQDTFMIRNLFFDKVQSDTKGFYVEAGANDYKFHSTSYFLDKCLGWDGLCIEPQVQYHENIRNERSCTLVPKCITTKESTEKPMTSGEKGHGAFTVRPLLRPLPPGESRMLCEPVQDILAQYNHQQEQHVDLLILHVEGAEETVLDSILWGETLDIDVFLIENNRIYSHRLDYDMNMRGYIKYHQLAIDSVFIKRELNAQLQSTDIWYPVNWDSFERLCELQGTCRRDCLSID